MGFATLPGNEHRAMAADRARMLSDRELLERTRNGDARAFGELFDRHSVAVYRYAWGLVRHDADAQELLQDTLLTAWSRRRAIRPVADSVLPWLLVTTRNHARNLGRRNAYRSTVPLLDSDASAADVRGELQWVTDAIAALGESDRRVCELCLVDGVSYLEAARALGITPAAVGKRLERARARLRKVALDNEN